MQQKQTGGIKNWLSRKSRRAAVVIAVVLPLALGVRAAVAEVFHAPTDSVAPEIPQHSRLLVYKLGRSFKPADIIVYRDAGGVAHLGRVVQADATQVTIARNGNLKLDVPSAQIVGKVVVSTR